jgi:hypothetical protein
MRIKPYLAAVVVSCLTMTSGGTALSTAEATPVAFARTSGDATFASGRPAPSKAYGCAEGEGFRCMCDGRFLGCFTSVDACLMMCDLQSASRTFAP